MSPSIVMRNIVRIYPGPPPVTALGGIDLTVDRGEYLSIVGPSGSGKTTLLNLFGLLDRPTSGTYELNGTNVAEIGEGDRTSIRGQSIGFVFQAFHLLPYRTALENVMLGRLYSSRGNARRRSAAADALARVGLSHRMTALPSTLSGGEKQRTAIARALVNNPSLLLCDEPTGNLDSKTAEKILLLLEKVHMSGQTVVVITHDPNVANRAERTITISDGLIDGGV
ncbi:putative ABC transport system ATP-binding protein [Actinomadura pelletieri DSM 43383]|uniref:Putative ABC transport system ATP-binding protein n=2 Tax=Actinomadura pelletieri TaxID=111805 RepID=A0A495Q993_9ACTN|nr:putative ABC transport system ATP-binding protein [Actinomadura pelletieri DSM 43383]